MVTGQIFLQIVALCTLLNLAAALLKEVHGSLDNRGKRTVDESLERIHLLAIPLSIPEYEYSALYDLYNATNGQLWDWEIEGSTLPGIPWNFTHESDPCFDVWQGVNCTQSEVDGYWHVAELRLTEMGMFGTLPDSICSFTELTQLFLDINVIYGTLPYHIGNLTNLKALLLGTNLFEGRVPESIATMKHMRALGLSVNLFTGQLPDLSQMTDLYLLDISVNAFTGTLPESLGQLSKLELLFINTNGIAGTLPASLGNLANMHRFTADHNKFIGTVPSSFGGMKELRRITLQNNALTGTIPSSLGSLTNLQICYIYNNHINGSIPSSFGGMASLQILSLQSNKLTGPLPAELCNCAGISAIRVYNNHMTGPFPPCFAMHTNFSVFVAYNNHFTGPLPSVWAPNSKMDFLDANGNKFSGQFPDSLGALPLTSIYFGSNQFTGTFPPSLNNLTNLQALYLPYNYMHGTIPPNMGEHMTQLQFFEINGNQMTGTIPATLQGMTVAQELHLDSNHFHGTIPAALVELASLTIFNVYNNHLTGTIPEYIGNLSKLQYLGFDGNMLTGTIPRSIGNLHFLQELEVYNNKLHGTLPNNLGNLTSLTALLLHGNRLSGTLDVAFRGGLQTALTTIQLSNNQFTGTLPDDAFRVPRLITFAAVGNCFTGTIPNAVCISPSLEVLALSGLQSASSCQQQLLPGLSGSYIITNPLTGGIPRCLFEMKSLTTLQISGNGITGSLPDDVSISPKLTSLTLSHNSLTGSIPKNFQQREWLNFDVSYNRLSGSLVDNMDTMPTHNYNFSNAGAALSLRNNRLSGAIPDSIKGIVNISVLDGNLFSCALDQSNLPQHDESKNNYQCASTTFNVPYYVWVGVVMTFTVLVFLLYNGLLPQPSDLQVLAEKGRRYFDILHVYANVAVVQKQLPNFRYVMDLYRRVCRIAILSALYIVVILLPIYAAMSQYYGTMTHQYAYTVSAAFHSGPVPLALEMTFLLLLLALVLGGFMHCWWMRSTQRNANSTRANITNADEAQSSLLNRLSVYGTLLVTNFTVVFGINIAYVYVALYADSGLLLFAQIVLSIFKIGWNKFCGSSLIPWTASYVSPSVTDDLMASTVEFFPLQLFLALFNNIAIPCVVVAVVSPNCFNYLLTSAPSVTSQYIVQQCLTFDNVNFVCTSFFPQVEYTSFNPPFTYSFQCSSSFITYYAPAYVIMCIMSGFGIPIGQLLLTSWYKYESDILQKEGVITWRFSLLDTILPALLKPPSSVSSALTDAAKAAPSRRSSMFEGRWTVVQRNIYSPHFAANQVLLNMFTYLGLLLTFGAMFPPLAVALGVTVVVVAIYAHMKVGRFLSMAIEQKQYKFVELIDKECRGVGTLKMLRRSTFMLLTNACWFYTLFLFDTLGDAVGIERAYWVLIVMPVLPLAILAGFALYSSYAPQQQIATYSQDSGLGLPSSSQDSINSQISDAETKANSTFNALHPDCEL